MDLMGCSASQGWSSGGNDAVGVACCVHSLLLLGQVVGPVVVEVAVAAERAELEDRLGAGQAPASARAVHAVFDQVPAGALDRAGGDRPATGERGRVVQVGLLVEQVGGGGVGGLALGGVQVVAGGLAADRRGDDADASVQDRPGVIVHQVWAAGSPSAKKHQAARHRYSSTCTKSTTIATSTPRAWASVPTRASWWLLPSTSATQVRCWSGSRRVASSNTWPITRAASAVTLATSHLPRARGRVRPGGWGWSGAGRTSPGVRGIGAQS